MFSQQDLASIDQHDITPKDVEKQLERFKKGFPPLALTSAASLKHGILKLSDEDLNRSVQVYESSDIDVLKFVPASGAATRMFKSLFALMDTQGNLEEPIKEDPTATAFFSDLKSFAFYNQLNDTLKEKEGITVEEALNENKHHSILSYLLENKGLNYGSLPKGLIDFHTYKSKVSTASEEHLSECADYAEQNGNAHLHFTVSPSHRTKFEQHISDNIKASGLQVNVTYSEQFPNTDTVAVTPTFDLFRTQNESLLFRPAGHGALLLNLNELDFDVIFIKNIDNVVPGHKRAEEILYKKALAGVLLSFQERVFKLLRENEKGKSIREEGLFLLQDLGMKGDFSEAEVLELLDRPLRVCGMVKNVGDPGGGPFWVKGDCGESLQIVESAQVDKSDRDQLSIFESGTHFNPVDIVCGVRNHKGEKYDLMKYRDESTGFISEKSFEGRKLLAMELPGLWNGSMANWNTVFVEVPLATFNPVKTVNDLLRPGHR